MKERKNSISPAYNTTSNTNTQINKIEKFETQNDKV